MAETHEQVAEQRDKRIASPYIINSDFDAASTYLELDPPQHTSSYSPSTTYTIGGLSPAWSLSSSNDTNSSPPMDSMFPSLSLGADQELSGWLQQFVSASALEQSLGLAALEPNMLGVLADMVPVSNIAPQELVAVGENAGSKAVGERGEMKRVVPLAPRQVGAQNRAMVDIKPRLASTNRPIACAERPIASADRRILPTETKQAIEAKPQAADPKLRPIAQAHSPNARSQDTPTPPDTVAQKRQERLIKNRAAALLSRKRKREYLTKLEVEVEDLRDANEAMALRMAEMERRLSAVTEERDLLKSANSSAQSNATLAGNNREPRKRSESKPEPESATLVSSKRQRTAGALLMAMLFSFSMFTLPSLFMGQSQISVGGVQSAGIVPAPQLLLPPVETEFPLVERVRRSINAFTQQGPQGPKQGPSRAEDESHASNNTDAHVRPMTMEESAGLHAWIRRGLKAGLEPSLRTEHTHHTSSLAIVNRDQSPAKQLDYAMLYCPSMKHVQFSNAQQVAEIQHTMQQPGPRVLDAMDHAVVSPQVERTMSHDLLVPTHNPVHLRPKMSLYSPIAQDAENSEILPPWDEYARLDDSDARQKYLRIDVEVVGSKWVTADKFANGLF
ncbi:hypothetical protein GGH96_000416 [Coemansia sp. RSA 1972]|nr:hypothetical protein GGH96_000416 [Coemansia sp. RSA 1972]